MEHLAESTISVVPLRSILTAVNSVAITFDDGFANFETQALPILAKYRFPATVFLVSGHCGGNNNWPGQSKRVPQLPLLTWTAIRQLGNEEIEWGAHTVTHPDLTSLPDKNINVEILGGDEIEQQTGRAVKSFAYPYGRCNAKVKAIASQRFDRCCGTGLDYVGPNADHLELPRLDAYYFSRPELMRDLLTTKVRSYVAMRRLFRKGRQWLSP